MLEQRAVVETNVNKNAVIAVTMATSRQGTGVVKELSKTNKYTMVYTSESYRVILLPRLLYASNYSSMAPSQSLSNPSQLSSFIW